MFNNSNLDVTKQKSWRNEIQYNMFCFISVGVRAVLRFFVSMENLGQYKKLSWDKFVKKKDISQNISLYAK